MRSNRDSHAWNAVRRARRDPPACGSSTKGRLFAASAAVALVAALTSVALIGAAAHPARAAFMVEQVDPAAVTVAWATHLRLSAIGEPHIVYHRTFAAPAGIQYATQMAGVWSIERVSPVGDYCSFDLDSQDAPHIAWGNGAGWDLRYMTKAAGAWTIETTDVGAVIVPSIALDSGDEPYIGYPLAGGAGYQLRVARRAAGAWTVEAVDATAQTFDFVSLALTSGDAARVAYRETGPVNSRLLYAFRSSGAWTVEEVDPALVSEGQFASLVFDDTDVPHLSYTGVGNVLRYASRVAGAWTAETVEAVGMCNGTSIDIDSDGNPHIVYQRGNTDLVHAWKEAGVWTVETVDGSAGNRGAFCSLALDAFDELHASYFDDTAQDVLYVASDALTGLPSAPAGSGADAGAGSAAAFLSVRPNIVGARGATVHLRIPGANASANANADLSVFDTAGRRVATLGRGSTIAGATALAWDGRDAEGRPLASGAYFLRLDAGSAAATERILIVR